MEDKVKTISVAEAVRRIILMHPTLLDAIKMNVINYSALAERIYPEVLEATGRNRISLEAIKMALIRFSEDIKRKHKILEKIIKDVISESVLELKSDIIVLTTKQETLMDKLDKLMENVVRARFFQLTQGLRTFTLIFDKRILGKILKTIGEENIEILIDNQSAIILVSPKTVIEVPGVIAYITSLLARKGINITQIISCHEDTILIVDREDASKAFSLIENIIFKLRS
ncbi:MAG: ACT domain-containing protein [archaeon GB-1867-035]|nr:ACT domain-containing protein [Candidatus Culexmicrobium profundum]